MINSVNFQSESKKSGDDFESLVLEDLYRRGFTTIKKNVYMANTGCEVDFVAQGEVFEYIECKGGKEGEKKRPGAKRTDNVKKAIANGSIMKKVYESMYYVVYFSDTPETGSYSDEMINIALKYKIIDEVRYLKPYDILDQ
jgi:predicted AAA+ superfamily ATPase